MSLDTHLDTLTRRHAEIERAIRAEEAHISPSSDLLQQLKKEKLLLKDQIYSLGRAAEQKAA